MSADAAPASAADYRRSVWTRETGPQFIAAEDVAREKPPAQSVEGLVYAAGVTVLVSESNAGKGFVALSLAAAQTAGTPWMGRRTIRGSVAYLSFEADALPLRLLALEGQGASLEDIYILKCSEPLSPVVTRDGAELPSRGEEILSDRIAELAARLDAEGRPPLLLVIVDTARSAMTGSEDKSENVAPFIRAVRRIIAAASPTCAAWVLHHAGWQDGEDKKERERGSSAWRGLVEVTLFLKVESENEDSSEASLTLQTKKARDSAKGRPIHLIRRRVDVPGLDAYGDPLSSCVIERDPQTPAAREAEAETACRAQREAEVAALEARVLDVLSKNALSSQDQLRQFLGCRRDVLAGITARLLSSGRIKKSGQRSPFLVVLP